MTDRISLSALALCLGLSGAPALAQTRSPAPAAATAPAPRTADYIVALVDGEPITNHEVRQRVLQLEQRLAEEGRRIERP